MRKSIAALVVAGALSLALASGIASATSAPASWNFDVFFDPAATAANGVPTWTGTASGPGSGTIATQLLAAEQRGEALHIQLKVSIDAGSQSSTVLLSGVFNEVTKSGVMNGVVASGWLAGAQAHQEATRFDPASAAHLFGTLQLIPASAD